MGTYTFWLTFLLEGQMGILTIFFIYCTSKIKKCANRSQRIKIDITKKWTGKRKDWGQIHSQLEIFFADRLPQ